MNAIRDVFAKMRERDGFRLPHYSVQADHIHLIVEALDQSALSRTMRTLCSRLARSVNRAVGRRGRLFAERYHSRELKSPAEVRRALIYVLRNSHHHERAFRHYLPPWDYDVCSSILEFDGFAIHREFPPPPLIPRITTVEPRFSYLLSKGWKRTGLIQITELPN